MASTWTAFHGDLQGTKGLFGMLMNDRTLRDLDPIRRKAEEFYRELEMELYLEGAGLKDGVNTSEIYERYAELSTKKLVIQLQSQLQKVSRSPEWSELAEEKRRAQLFLEGTVQAYLSNLTREWNDRFLLTEGRGVIAFGDGSESLTYRMSAIALMNEPNRKRRADISRARDRFVESELNPILTAAFEISRQKAPELGFKNYAEMCESLSGLDLYGFHTMTEQFLADTDEMYWDVLSWFARRKLDISPSNLKKHDLSFLARLPEYDHLFPPERMVDAVLGFVRKMGLDPTSHGCIHLDLETRSSKSPRAFCSPVQIPNEVYLVIAPGGGIDDYQALLHELGHALHFGHTNPGLAWEYRRFGDSSVTEGYAFLFEHLASNKEWLRSVMGFGAHDDFIRYAALIDLMMFRRYAAKLSYELLLHDGRPLTGKESHYVEFLSEATRARYSPANFLDDVDPFFYCARYLRAWILESMLSQHLIQNYDSDWFLNPRTGKALQDFWSMGQKFTAEEFTREIHYPQLTFDIVKDRFDELLGA